MRILLLSPRQCWPPHSGAKLRTFHAARALGRRSDLTHLFFAESGATTPTAQDLPFCRRLVPVPSPERFSPSQIARGFLGRWPLPILHYVSSEMKAALASLMARERFDLLYLDGIHMAPYAAILRELSPAPIVYDWHNIESEVMRRYAADTPSPARKLYAAVTAWRLAALEKRILRDALGHFVCSERERRKLQRIAPEARIAVIENGVDTRYFREAGGVCDRRRILYVGHMAYHANAQAAISFTRDIWPALRERFPSWRLTLAGSNPAPAVIALGAEKNVEVTGAVPDLRPYYREAVAAIVPLRVGGGTRLKILEAMAAGVPVVSTRIGAEGLPVTPGADLLIADADEDWLRHLSALSAQDGMWMRLAGAGRQFALRYDWDALGESLWNTCTGWLEPVAARAEAAAARG
jgi:polysaccharide biosynthesis protein PslH